MTRQINEYLEELYQEEEPDFIKIVRKSCPEQLQKMQLSISEVKLLVALVRTVKPKRILELGTLVGTSALWLAGALEVGGKLITVEKSYNHYLLAKSNLEKSPVADQIEIVHSDALIALESMKGEVFDVIFIDAKKSEYSLYLPLAKRILRQGGLLLFDNSLMFDKGPEIAATIKSFNATVQKDCELYSVIIPTTAGLTYAIKL